MSTKYDMKKLKLKEFLNNDETAFILGIEPNTLEVWRSRGEGPDCISLTDSPKAPVRYTWEAIDEFKRRRTRPPGEESRADA